MPFYEYVCTLCGNAKTILQKVSDAPAVDCPACGKPGLIKQISASGFRLKGAGWYETDFKSDNKKNLAGEGSNGGEKAQTAEKPAEKADKPAEKTDAAAPAPVKTPAPSASPAATPAKPAPPPTAT